MEDKEKALLEQLENDIKKLSSQLYEVANDVVKHGFSKYPVLIAHKDDIAIADKILDRFEQECNFHFSATTLEVLVAKGVLLKDKKSDLENHLDQNPEMFCVLLVHPQVMKVIFSPLKQHGDKKQS